MLHLCNARSGLEEGSQPSGPVGWWPGCDHPQPEEGGTQNPMPRKQDFHLHPQRSKVGATGQQQLQGPSLDLHRHLEAEGFTPHLVIILVRSRL